ncbi:MAG: hypothetical protein CMJ32_05020 [Phycisphaerae bacterium]|nr:hypothetical protein [Phycisphaerae bacterium]
MTENQRNFLVGLSTMVALAGLALLLMFFGEFDTYINARYPMRVSLNSAGGLRQGSPVTMDGVPVGIVQSVSLTGQPDAPVMLVILVNDSIRVPDPSEPVISTALISGSSKLELNPTAEARLQGRYYVVSETIDESPLLRGTYEDTFSSIQELARTYTVLGQNINQMLQPLQLDENGAPIDQPDSLRTTVRRANQILVSVNDAVMLAQSWLDDDLLRQDARDAVANAAMLFQSATIAVDRIGQLASSLEGNSEEVVVMLRQVSDRISSALDQVNQLAAKAGNGEGTIGLLLNDPNLYQSLADAATRLDKTLKQIELMVQKIRDEGLSVDF